MTPDQHTIFITGGTSGIGLALAQRFLAAGNRVIISGRRAGAIAALTAAHPGLEGVVLDVTDATAVAETCADLIARFPEIDVLFNNAGIMLDEDLTAPDLAVAEQTVVTNLLAPMWVTAAFIDHLRGKERALIVNTTSGLAFVPLARTPAYSATKAGLHSWTQSLRAQLAGSGVEVVELAPPAVATDLQPGHAENPICMPLGEYIDEVMSLLAQEPTPAEILVERVKFLRFAEAQGAFDNVFGMLNGAH